MKDIIKKECQILSFSNPVGSRVLQEDNINGLNYTIEPKPDNKFYIDARIEKNGKQYRKRKTVEGKRNAQRVAQELVWKLEDSAEISSTSSVQFFEKFNECVTFYKSNFDRWESNASHLKRVEQELGDVQVAEIQGKFELMLNRLENTVSCRGTTYSNNQLNRWIERVNAVLNFNVKHDKIPHVKLKFKKYETTPRDIAITPRDIEKILESIKKYRPYLLEITQYALSVPTRVSELLNLEKEYVDVDMELIRLKCGSTKNGKGVSKPIPPNLIEHFSSIPDEVETAFFRRNAKGEQVPLKRFTKAWKFCLEKSSVNKNIRFHDLRHYSASKLLNAGMPERQIGLLAGWKTPMLSVYYHKDSVEASRVALEMMKSGRV